MLSYDTSIDNKYIAELGNIKKSLSSYPGYMQIASSLGKIVPQNVVAGLIGCIIPESGTNHRILNAKEYSGNGASGTSGWNCGEGLIQWTYWKYKLPLIKKYNADSRATQKLPEDWNVYKQGSPIKQGNSLLAPEDGRHIAGLSLDNQMLFLVLYYSNVIDKIKNETSIAKITAAIYQFKAGNGFLKNISNPVERAYETSAKYYPSSAGNHYLQSVKIACEYCGVPITPGTYDSVVNDTYYASNDLNYYEYTPSGTNVVNNLTRYKRNERGILTPTEGRMDNFESLRNSLIADFRVNEASIYKTEELYDTNILKGEQESKIERT